MTRRTKFLTIGLAAAVLAALTSSVSWAKSADTEATDAREAPAQVLRVQFWHLWQDTGAELYQEMCASCHGVDGAGNGPAARALTVPPPALTHLKRAGIPQQHWTYVLSSACEDEHHWARDGHETMPCWRRVFRQALGNEAAPLLVSKKLVNYLASIQQ